MRAQWNGALTCSGHHTAGASSFGERHGALDGAGVPGNDHLVRRVEIRCADHLALRGFSEDRIELAFRQFEDGGHGAHARRNGLLHVAAAVAHQADGVAELQALRRHQRRIFAQAVASHEIRGHAALAQHGARGRRYCEQRGLLVFGELELIVRAFKAEP
jgi:hypothetical protein